MAKSSRSIAITSSKTKSQTVKPVREEIDLLARIKASLAFKKTAAQGRLLQFLYDNRFEKLVSKDIEAQHYKRTTLMKQPNPAHTRERIADLRERLDNYFAENRTEPLICWLPEPSANEGYQLSFKPASLTFADLFWMPHLLHRENNVIATDTPVFFENEAEPRFVRFSEGNDVWKSAPDGMRRSIPGSPELTLRKRAFLAAGDIRACETLTKWLFKRTGFLIERYDDTYELPAELRNHAAIVIGGQSSNRHSKELIDRKFGAQLTYVLDETRNTVTIRGITEQERADLRQFSISEDGTVGPLERHQSFGVVVRLSGELSQNPLTIISSGHNPLVSAGMAGLLLEEDFHQDAFQQLKWREKKKLPDSFEMLFSMSDVMRWSDFGPRVRLLTWREIKEVEHTR